MREGGSVREKELEGGGCEREKECVCTCGGAGEKEGVSGQEPTARELKKESTKDELTMEAPGECSSMTDEGVGRAVA